MIDSGSDATLIRSNLVKPDIPCNRNEFLTLQGIASTPLVTLGSVIITLLGVPVKFHLIPDDFVLPHDGILALISFPKQKPL